MSVIGLRLSSGAPRAVPALRRYSVELCWGVFALACYSVMLLWQAPDPIPLFLVWISLALVYGIRVWTLRTTMLVMFGVVTTSSAVLAVEALQGTDHWKRLISVPLMSALFVVMVWYARGRVDALRTSERQTKELHAALERQERFIHDASHELKTPLTIARGHLELGRTPGDHATEIAIDELRRIDGILGQLLLLATAGQPSFLRVESIELEPFLEEIFIRWSGVAPRSWRLGTVGHGCIRADPERLRTALDALLDNAVKYSDDNSVIELRAHWSAGDQVVIEVEDEGIGVPSEATSRIFARFGRVDVARTRSDGGVGLGLAIVDAIASRHGGRCVVRSGPSGSVFSLHLPANAA
jgi:two-component system, OmpR family, sensor kinase